MILGGIKFSLFFGGKIRVSCEEELQGYMFSVVVWVRKVIVLFYIPYTGEACCVHHVSCRLTDRSKLVL